MPLNGYNSNSLFTQKSAEFSYPPPLYSEAINPNCFLKQEIETPDCKDSFFISTGHDVVFSHSIIQQIVIEQNIQQIWLTTSAGSGNNFYKTVLMAIYQLLKIYGSFYLFHVIPYFCQ